MKRKRWVPWIYSAPALVLILVVIVFPICYTAYISQTNMSLYHWLDDQSVGLENYRRALLKVDSGFLSALFVTVAWTGINILIQVAAAYLIALGLNAKGLTMRRVYKTLLMFPWAMPAYVSVLVWKVGMFNTEFGLLNKILAMLGMKKVDFLSANLPAFLSCLLLNLWMALPFMIVMIDGALQSIDPGCYESAVLDGAGFWKRNRYITVPAIWRILAPAVVMTTFTAFKQFDIFYLLLRQKGSFSGATIDTILTYAYENAFVSNNYGLSSAVSMVIFVIIILLSLGTNQTLREEKA